jgi:hypothetical protein
MKPLTPTLPNAAILEAEREVHAALNRGLLYSPEEAWAAPGNHDIQTLWSIASRVALKWDISPEDLCTHLESSFRHCRYHKGWLDSRLANDEPFF